MDQCFRSEDSSGFASLLQSEGLSSSTLCKLNHLVTKELCQCGFSRVLMAIKSLAVLSENKDDLQMLIGLGLTAKVIIWFESVRDLLTLDLHRRSAPLFTLIEEFFDFFLLLGQASIPVCQISVVLVQLAHFALQTELHFPLRLEAIRTFNSILESLDHEQRRLIQSDENQTQILSLVAAALPTAGDYELQISLSEALCRMTPRRDRVQKASHWFPGPDIRAAFCDIRNADFEVDCRRFLNIVNGYYGDKRRVYTFPCLRAVFGSTELFRPKDDKLEEFWVDFNVGSGCVSFFVDDPQGFLWQSIHLLKEEVEHSNLQLKHDKTVLSVKLANPITHHNSRAQMVELSFKREHHGELEKAAERVFKMGLDCPHHISSREPGQSGSPVQHMGQTYSRKKPSSKSQLKILPLSSPSSEDDSPTSKPSAKNKAETLFDQIQHSTPKFCCESTPLQDEHYRYTTRKQTKDVSPLPFGSTHDVGISETHLLDLDQPESANDEDGAEPEESEDQTVDMTEGSFSLFKQDAQKKREAAESGYLSDHTEGVSACKKKAESQQSGDNSNLALTGGLPEEPVSEEGRLGEGTWKDFQDDQPLSGQRAEPEACLSSDIITAFKSFAAQLEQHFTGWQKVETEVLLSLQECQQHVSSLLTAVHQHRLLQLQQFERSIIDQLKNFEENLNLNSINSKILNFVQSEMHRISSFCEEHMQTLKTLTHSQLEADHPSS